MTNTTKPQYKHDCDQCQFLGVTIGGGRVADLYAHVSPSWVTLIARYGDEGREYFSTNPEYATPTGHAELWAAKSLWESRDD